MSNPTEPTKFQTLTRLLAYLKPYWWAFVLVFLAFLLGGAMEAASASLMGFIVDALKENHRERIFWFPFLILLLFFLRGVSSFVGGYYTALMSRSLVYKLRIQVFNKLLLLPSSFYLNTPAGELNSKILFDVEQVTAASTESLTTLLKDGIKVLSLVGFLFYTNWRLTLVLLIVLPPIVYFIRRASKQFSKLSFGIQDSMAEISHIAHEAVSGFRVVKNYGGQAYEARRFEQASQNNLQKGLKMVVVQSINSPLVQFLMATGLCFVIWLALRPEVMGEMSTGDFIAYLSAAGMLSQPVKALTDVNQRLQRGIAGAASVFSLLDRENEQDLGKLSPVIQGKISFENVSLTYDNQKTAIKNFNLQINAGETIAVVGRSGSGKSSLVNLLTRDLDASGGRILIDDVPIGEIRLQTLRDQIAMVNQQVTLFLDTVANNIAYGSLSNKSRQDIENAAKAAFAHDFIMKLPDGYDTLLGVDGLQLSGGQRQRLSIARALLKDAPILILDEATSALDNESEHFIQQALEKVMHNRTTIVIAHRLSTIENADRIIVLDDGEIIEMGNHAELLAKKGAYAAMYERNFDEQS